MPFVGPEIEHGLDVIGELVRGARRERGWTQFALERASGVDQTVISRLENGVLTSLRLIRLAAIFAALDGHGPGREGMTASRLPLDGRPRD
jgi:transcriptional regulator with XRE-family HTH domain